MNNNLYNDIMKDVSKVIKKHLNEQNTSIYNWLEKNNFWSIVWDCIGEDMTWEDWEELGSIDRDEFLYDALLLIDDDTYTAEDLYEIYHDWANALTEEDFEDYDNE